MTKVDLAKFRKMQEDDACTTLQHADGHAIKVAHAGVSAAIRKQLRELPLYMAEGGQVEERESPEEAMASAYGKAFGIDPTPAPAAPIDIPTDPQGAAYAAAYNQQFQEPVAAPPPHTPIGGAAPASLAPAPAQAAPMAVDPYGVAQQEKGMLGAIQHQKAGITQEAQALGDLGRAEADVAQREASFMQDVASNTKKNFDEYLAEGKRLIQDYEKGAIDPNRFRDNMSTGAKTRTAIGLILGGLGAGMSGQENMAMKFLNQNIERDIESQKAMLGKKQNLLNFNMQQFGNLRDATDMTVAMQKAIFAADLRKAAGLAQDPIAKARALKASGELEMQAAPLLAKVAERRAITQGLTQGRGSISQAINVVVPENQRNEALKELNEFSRIQSNLSQVDTIFKKAFEATKVGNNVMSPIKSANQRKVAVAQLFPIVKSVVGEAMHEADVERMIGPYLSGMMTSEGGNEDNLRAFKSQLVSIAEGKTPILKEYGLLPKLSTSARSPEEERIYNWAKANQGNPQFQAKANMVLQKLGDK